MKKYPIRKMIIDVEVLGGEVELTELSQGFCVSIGESGKNLSNVEVYTDVLVEAGLTKEQVSLLPASRIVEIGQDVVTFTNEGFTNGKTTLSEEEIKKKEDSK